MHLHRFPLILWLTMSASACAQQSGGAAPDTSPHFALVGRIDTKGFPECSGVVESRKYPGIYWAIADSGNPGDLVALNREGKIVARYAVAAPNVDWEDIALDDVGHLYIGDIGNNGSRRAQLLVYQLDEPDPSAPHALSERLRIRNTWRVEFAGGRFDCEAMFVREGYGYLISKEFLPLGAGLFRFPLTPAERPVKLERLCTLPIRSPVTAADLSRDGKRLAVLSVTGLHIYDEVPEDLAKLPKARARFVSHLQGDMEACCFTDGGVLVATESGQVFMVAEPAEPEKSQRGPSK